MELREFVMEIFCLSFDGLADVCRAYGPGSDLYRGRWSLDFAEDLSR